LNRLVVPLLGTAGLGAWPALLADQARGLLLVLAGVAVFAALAGLAGRRPGLFLLALVLLVAEYALALLIGGAALQESAPLFGVVLLVVAELGYAAIAPTVASPAEPGIARRRALGIATLAALGIAASGFVWGVAHLRPGDGVVVALLGIFGAALVLASLAGLAARTGRRG
jgi:peptidoglycan/LPS O-acetylase OafA/YrhL